MKKATLYAVNLVCLALMMSCKKDKFAAVQATRNQ
jgi:hypothetical protein